MKIKTLCSFVALTVWLSVSAWAQSGSFEGIVSLTIEQQPGAAAAAAKKTIIDFKVKGEKTAAEVRDAYGNHQNAQARFIMNENTDELIILSDKGGQKTAVKYGLQNFVNYSRHQANKVEQVSDNKSESDFQETGKTKTINGYRCKQVIIKSRDAEGEYWYTEAADFNFRDLMPLMKGVNPWSEAGRPDIFIMQGWHKNTKPGETWSYSVNIQSTAVSPGLFVVGSEYEVKDLSGMLSNEPY